MVVNEKRYGRRSRPFDAYSDTNPSADEGDVESISGSRPSSPDIKPTLEKQRRMEHGDDSEQRVLSPKERRLSRGNSQKLRKRESLRKRDSIRRQESTKRKSCVHSTKEEILEASGQISHGSKKWSPHQSIDDSGR